MKVISSTEKPYMFIFKSLDLDIGLGSQLELDKHF